MNFIYDLFKKIFFFLILGIDLDYVESCESETSIDQNTEDNLENTNSTVQKKTTLTSNYLKFVLISGLSFISLIIIMKVFNSDIDMKQLQNLLNELATIVDWELYRDIFLNIQKLLSGTIEKDTVLYVLTEIHLFFSSNTDQVYNHEKFDKIMKKIISLLNDKY